MQNKQGKHFKIDQTIHTTTHTQNVQFCVVRAVLLAKILKFNRELTIKQ